MKLKLLQLIAITTSIAFLSLVSPKSYSQQLWNGEYQQRQQQQQSDFPSTHKGDATPWGWEQYERQQQQNQ
jgi:hypothetical protein